MNLIKEKWLEKDINEFENFLQSLSKGKEKSEWEKRIINTNLPCIAVPSPEIKKVVNEIFKGNYIDFLNLWIWNNFSETSIIGGLICKIKSFDLMKDYLDKYAEYCDNWATCDLLKFPIKENNKKQFYELSLKYIKSKKTFTRRLGITILFKFVDDNLYIDSIFKIMNSLYNENEYYVNMVLAWLFAECFTKQREKTLKFLNNHKLNKFVINKGICKCRDSFRISKEDKEMLLSYRQK